MKVFYCLLILSLLSFSANSQQVTIPGFTGYAIPAEQQEEEVFNFKQRAAIWKDPNQVLHYYFYLRKKGTLQVSLLAKNKAAGSLVQVTIPGKKAQVTIPKSDKYVSLKVGSTIVKDSGFYEIKLEDLRQGGQSVADIQGIELSGTAVPGMHCNTKPRRNAASVHLRYPLPDSAKAVAFYNEITVPIGADAPHSYYMSNGFSRGYFGIQIISPTERRVIFSIWDAGNEPIDRTKVPENKKVQLLATGKDVVANGFGNEGTGGHSHWVYPWKNGTTYGLLVTAVRDSANSSTLYTGYIYLPEMKQWKLLACFKAPMDGGYLKNLYSFVENFSGENGQLQRLATYGNQWVQMEDGKWEELTNATFSTDATGRAGDRIDYGAGESDGQFYLWNGGFQPANVKMGDRFSRSPLKAKPIVTVNNQVDSTWQAQKDKALILQAIQKQQLDTTGSLDGVYYTILEKGTGAPVQVADTVQVFYKGYFLESGVVFDQTGASPATFPLRRLIKGWQIGVPLGNVGGKVRIIIPSGLAYGIRNRSAKIAPNSILAFDIQVVGVRKQGG